MIVIFKMLSVIPLEYESMKVFRNVMNVDKDLKKKYRYVASIDIEFRSIIIK